MRIKTSLALRVLAVSSAVYAADVAVDSSSAFASALEIFWTQDVHIPGYSGGAGCANQIAVGPNNAPWVLGCGGPDGINDWLFQLEHQSGAIKWVNSGAAGVYTAVDDHSVPWLLTNNGHIWASVSFFGQAQTWIDIIAQNAGQPFGNGRLSAIAPQTTGTNGDSVLWGFGYPATANTSIWDATYNLGGAGSAWSQVDPQDNAAASQISQWTGTLFGTSYQLPVVVNSFGNIYSYDSSTGTFSQFAASYVAALTDHWVIAWDGNISNWALFYYNDFGGWVEYLDSLRTPNGTQIVKIAYSNIGGSALWGIDNVGHIFTSNPSQAINSP